MLKCNKGIFSNMKGFILNIRKYKEEDLIVTILTREKILNLYRFYGARHSSINLGYKIDFEIERTVNISISKLRNIIELALKYNRDYNKILIWNQFISLVDVHLRGVEEVDCFYYDLLEKISYAIEKQNPKRACIEGYILLLEHEGRLHDNLRCFVCEEAIADNLALARSFLPAHTNCIYSKKFDLKKVAEFFKTKKLTNLHDTEVDELWKILSQGI